MARKSVVHTPTRLSVVAPSTRLTKVKSDVAAAEKVSAQLRDKAAGYEKGALEIGKDIAKQQARADSMFTATPKSFEKAGGKLIPAVFLPTRKDNTSLDTEGAPAVPELVGSHKTARPVYHGDKKHVTKDALTGEGLGRKVTKELSGPKLGVCDPTSSGGCGGKVADHTHPKTKEGTPDFTKLIHPRTPAGSPRIGGHGGTPHVAPTGGPRIPTDTSSARMVRAGIMGRQGGKPHDIKDRNIETPDDAPPSRKGTRVSPDELARLRAANKKPEAFFSELSNWLLEYILKATMAPIKRYEPKKHGELPPLRNTHPLPPGASNAERETTLNAVQKATLWMTTGRVRKPETKKEKAAQFNALFGEEYMNPNKIANEIIREAFTSGGRNNTTPADNTISAKGGTQRQMLAGEYVGSAAWPFDQASNDMFRGSTELQMAQAHAGEGELVMGGGSAMEAVATEIIADLLEDSPSSILSDPDSVGYLINEMCEAGYCAEADKLKDICKDAKEEDVIAVSAMIDKLEAEKADPFLVEQLTRFATQFLITEEDADMPSGASDVNSPKDDAAESTDDNKGGSEA